MDDRPAKQGWFELNALGIGKERFLVQDSGLSLIMVLMRKRFSSDLAPVAATAFTLW